MPLLARNVVGLLRRGFKKLVWDRITYGRGSDYDASRYWRDRLGKYGESILGPGHEGLSESENEAMYRAAAQTFREACQRENVDLANARVLEVGVGTGFYARLLREAGVKSYTGLDITDVLFPKLREELPGFRFERGDVTVTVPPGPYDLVVVIDVIQHIVTEEKFAAAMQNVRQNLAPGGIFLLSSVHPIRQSKRHLWYVRWWSEQDVRRNFSGHGFGRLVPFRDSHLFTVRAPA